MTDSEKVKVIAFVGSPRRGGNTEILVDEILAGAEASGALVEKIILNELEINPCQACDECKNSDSCIIDDDMELLKVKMEESQVWILATPIYWWGPSAQLKAFIDRWYGIYRGGMFKGKNIILAMPMGDKNDKTARHAVGMMIDSINYLNMNLLETILAPGAYDLGEIKEQSNILEKARSIGNEIIQRVAK
ncbi:MAG: flavodoxin family protein [Candidatus Kariarchaeaceae archaeon]